MKISELLNGLYQNFLGYLHSLLEFLVYVCTLGSTHKAIGKCCRSSLPVNAISQSYRSRLSVKVIGQGARDRCTCALITMCCTCAGSLGKRVAETFLSETESETVFRFTFEPQYSIVDSTNRLDSWTRLVDSTTGL